MSNVRVPPWRSLPSSMACAADGCRRADRLPRLSSVTSRSSTSSRAACCRHATSSCAARGSSSVAPDRRARCRAAKTLIEGRGKFAMPGLIDAARAAGALLARRRCSDCWRPGITAVVDVGTDPAVLARWRQDLNDGRLLRAANRASLRRPSAAAGRGWAPRPVWHADSSPGPFHERAPVRPARRLGNWCPRPARPRAARSAPSRSTAARASVARLGSGELPRALRADLVVLTANPLDDIRHARAIDAVVFRGEVLTQAHVPQLGRSTAATAHSDTSGAAALGCSTLPPWQNLRSASRLPGTATCRSTPRPTAWPCHRRPFRRRARRRCRRSRWRWPAAWPWTSSTSCRRAAITCAA